MSSITKFLLVVLMFLTANSYALEEPPGAQSQEDADLYIEKLRLERLDGLDPLAFSSTLKGIEKSWEDAVVFLPGKTFSTSASKVNLDKRYPVVIYLHGCAGIVPYQNALQTVIPQQRQSAFSPMRISFGLLRLLMLTSNLRKQVGRT